MIEYPVALLEWCEALESGNFPQGQGYLREEIAGILQGYCCLGVFAMLRGGFDEEGRPLDRDLWPTILPDTRPYPCVHRIGTHAMTEVFPHHTERQRRHLLDELMVMNDDGASFGEIAEEIKREYRQSVPAAG